MTCNKAITLLAGCEVFENQTGKKIIVHWAKSLSPFVVEIKGVTVDGENQGVPFYSSPRTWTNDQVT